MNSENISEHALGHVKSLIYTSIMSFIKLNFKAANFESQERSVPHYRIATVT